MYFGIAVLIIMVIISAADLRSREIPVFLIYALAATSLLSIICDFFGGRAEYTDILISLLPGALLLIIALITRQSVGYGDGLVLLLAGPSFGGDIAVLGVIAALFASGIVSGALLSLRRAGKSTKIPFVPFMTLGMGVIMFAKG